MSKITTHGKNKIGKIRDGLSEIIKETLQQDNYLTIYQRQINESNNQMAIRHLIDFGIDLDILKSINIPYFCYERWNFKEAYLICLYSGLFKMRSNRFVTNEIYIELMEVCRQMRKWSDSKLLSFLDWLNQKPDITPISKQHLHCQIIDTLLQYQSRNQKPINHDILTKKKWLKTNKYLILDYNLEIDPDKIKMLPYIDDDLKICTKDYALYEICLDLMGSIRQNIIDQIIDVIKSNKRSAKKYFNLDTLSIVTTFQANKSTYRNDTYCLCGNNNKQYTNYLSELQEIGDYAYRLYENLEIIIQNIDNNSAKNKYYTEGMTYINIETWKKNKTSGNKEFVNNEYLIIADDPNKYQYYLNELKNNSDIKPLLLNNNTGGILSAIGDLLGPLVYTQTNNSSPTKPNVIKKKPRRRAIPKRIRYQVWREAFDDKMSGHCYCCNDSIKFESWECGHIKAHANGGTDTVNNLVPICSACNKSMSSHNMIDWMQKYNMAGLKNFKL